jgi:PAS domain S-box-containing protein
MKSERSAEYDRELNREQRGTGDTPRIGRVRVLNRTISWCDDAFAEMFGYTPQELIGKPTRLLHATDQGYIAFRDAAFPVIARGEIFRTELQQRRKEGMLGWYDISVYRSTPDSDEQNGAFIDITARRQKLLEVLKAEEHYRTLFVAMVAGVCVHAHNGQIIEANPAAERILQLDRDQLLGRTPRHPQWQAIREDGTPFPGEEHPASITLRTGQAVNQQIMGVRARGAPLRWISINSQPVFEVGQTQPSAAIVTFMDITEQRRMTDDLQKTRTRLQSILDHVPAMIGYWNRDLRCGFANSAYLDGFGLSPEHIVGMPMPELMGTTLFEMNEPYVRQALSGIAQHFERALVKADGSTSHVDAFYIPDFDPHGIVRGLFFMGSDITALRASTAKARELTRHLEVVRDEERKNIAQALHEGIAQDVFAAKLMLDYLKARARTGEPMEHERLWLELSETIAQCMRGTREIANELRPSALAHLDVGVAIAEYARRIETVSGLKVTVGTVIPLPALDPAIRSILLSAAQEALTNVIRHAAATNVGITIGAQGNIIALEIIDDGFGIEAGATSKAGSFGLLGIRERLEALGGELTVSRIAKGTRFFAQTPIIFE